MPKQNAKARPILFRPITVYAFVGHEEFLSPVFLLLIIERHKFI